jgi:hypothetical protein
MSDGAREAAQTYFAAWQARDFDQLRSVLADDATNRGPLGAANTGQECLDDLRDMARIVTGLNVNKVFTDGPDVLTWYDLHTLSASPTPAATWMHVEDGKITRIRTVFDPRELAAQDPGGPAAAEPVARH